MVEGKLLHEVWPPDFIPNIVPLHRAALEGREITVDEDYAGRRYSVTYAPVRDDEGHIQCGMVMLRNISAEKQAEEALQHSEARLRAVWESAGDAMSLSDPEGIVLAVNPAYAELYGFTQEEVVGNSFAIIFPQENRADAIEQYKEIFQGAEQDALYERQVRRADGECRWVESRAKFIVENGERVAMLAIVRDITSRRSAEEALRASEERLQLIARATADLLWDYDLIANKLWWSQAYRERVGLLEGQEPGVQLWRSTLHPHDCDRAVAKVEAVRAGNDQYWTQEYRIRVADGSYMCVLDRGYVMRDEAGRAVRMLGAMQDITQRKAHEQQIAGYAASQTHLLHQVMYAQEAERRRLSMEIHDGPLQSLGVSLLALDRAMRRREIGDDEHVELELRFLRQQISDTVQEVRGVLADLSHEVLDTYGLAVALQNHVDRFSDVTGIEVTLQNSLHKRLSGDKELLLYRLAQEAFANVRKHAGAEQVTATLGREGDQIKLTIQDDGRGFDVQEALHRHVDGQGVGLRSMQERIKAVGGRMEITSQPGHGTTITFWCPAE
jgi:PAS domain S-box-containing protein